MSTNTEIRAQYLKEFRRFDDDAVLLHCRAADEKIITIKGKAEEGELDPGQTYSFYGRWTNHYRYGLQFAAQTFTKVTPHDEKGIIAYLLKAPHVGAKTAVLLWKLFQGEAVRRLREDPEAVAERVASRFFSAARAKEAAAYLEQESGLEDASIRCVNLLAGKGFPRDTTKSAIRVWGNLAPEVIQKNAFKLMRFRGCGFGRCDELFLQLGGNPAKLKRQALCIWYGISRDMDGNTWFSADLVEKILKEKLGSAEARPVEACILAKRSGLLSVHRPGPGMPWITESGRSAREQEVADQIAYLLAQAPAWPSLAETGLELSEHQQERLAEAVQSPVAVFVGSPGTGKTYTAARLIGRLIQIHGAGMVAVVAPTGKAAVRITEALEGYGIGLRARTIHSYLGVTKADDQGFAFEHGPGNPLEARFIVCDEASMVDVSLLASLLGALRPDGHLLLVGDIQQLPPVGHGAPLRDLLAAGVPSGELREIRRNSGLIVETCARIRDEEHFDLPRTLDLDQGVNLKLAEAAGGEAACTEIMRLVKAIGSAGLADPVWETQVVVAVNEKSQVSRKELNKLLQAELNGGNRSPGQFWPNDKIVCLKNCFLPAVEEAMDDVEEDEDGFVRTKESGAVELYVANGEIGRVLEDLPNKLILEFSSPKRVVLVPRGDAKQASESGKEDEQKVSFDLGYAISCHKSQGSEWPIVIIALDDSGGAKYVCDRSWLYTAISRAKKACILVGREETARAMCRRQKLHHRKTFLVERLAEARKKYVDPDLGSRRETVVLGGTGTEGRENNNGSSAREEPAPAENELGRAADGALHSPGGQPGEVALSV